jgi:GDP-L-fucose synthase
MAAIKMKLDSKIYVAGHRGLLGSAVVRRLKKSGYENLLLRTSAELDLSNQENTYSFLNKEKPDFVFLCAAKVGGIKANMEAQGDFLFRNLQIQNNVIEGARRAGVKKLLFVGSSCIYPKAISTPIREDQLLTGALEETNEGYAVAKIAGIKLCQFYRRQHGCDYISAIPSNLFGISDNFDLNTGHMLPAMIHKAHLLKGKSNAEITVWGTGTPRREFMLSDDCADAMIFIMENYSAEEPINIGTGKDETILNLVKTVLSTLEINAKIIFDSSKPDGMMRKVLDVAKLHKLGWQSKFTIEEGIRIAYEDFLGSKK